MRNQVASGAYLRALREQHELTQSDLATRIGTTQNTISRIEIGQQEPKLEILIPLLVTLGGSIDDLAALLRHPDASPAMAADLAAARMRASGVSARIRSIADRLHQLADELTDSPS